jgi:hypothetical protein
MPVRFPLRQLTRVKDSSWSLAPGRSSRLTLSGTVSALLPDGLTMTAADGSHRVIVGSATVVVVRVAGQQIVVGEAVRVTGYPRGDGVILATRITITSKP